ncbi:MAG: glycosyltransferase family 4 protein [Planctomycetota bacterium]
MKLLFLTQVIDANDAVLGFVPRWIQGLARRCERVRVVALEAGDTSTLPANVDVRIVGRRGTLSRWWRYRGFLREAFEEDGFDACLAHMVPRYALLAAGPAQRAGARNYLWYTHAAVDARLRRAVRKVEKVFTASPESLRVDTGRRVVTGHGIDLDHFDRRDELPEQPARLLAVGRLTPAKDPLTVLAAVSVLVHRGFDLHLDLVGAGLTEGDRQYMRTIEAAIEVGGVRERIHAWGSVPYRDVPRWYARSTAVVNASLTGSLDKVVLEAMASRRPVVSCNPAASAVLARVGDDGRALTFEAGRAADLADRLQGLLEMSRARRADLGSRLRELVAREHEVDALMDRLCAEMGGAR